MTTVLKHINDFMKTDENVDTIFTPEDFTDEHLMMRDALKKYLENDLLPALPQIERQQFEETKKAVKKAGDVGLLMADIEEQDGGLGLGKITAAIINEDIALGRSFSITFGGQTGIGALPIAYFGNEEQKEKYLPSLLSGEKIAAYALTEPSSGTDAMSLRTTAKLSEDGTHYILNGEKQWITNSAFASIFIVYAKVDAEKITAFIVESDYEGVSTGAEEDKMGLKGSSTRSLILEDVKVPVGNVIGEIGRGHIIAFNVLNMGRHKIALTSLGTAKRALELAVTYGNERKQFNRPLTQFNLLKNKIADMAILSYANESQLYRTAGAMNQAFEQRKESDGTYAKTIAPFAVLCSINKVFSTEVLDFVVDEAVQIHGGYGYMAEYEVETLYRDSRINRIFEGTNEINRILIASTLFNEYENTEETEFGSDGILAAERQKLKLFRKLFHEMGKAVKAAGLEQLNEEQEIAAFLADLAIAIYVAESIILRTEKAIHAKGELKSGQKLDCARVFIHEKAQEIGTATLNIMNFFKDGEVFSNIVSRLITSSPIHIVETKRRVADRVISAEKYVV
ncbi:acyl-CoA dehydrogenases [Bacillus sp. OxB-1]|uniref:acyl-CoA dehydrogenase family protein n=1 Tax=Bacillus sp. (strain OxB-1) TaxID=98228 RepID=UPI000581DB6F|nr:acyl-CoA dehydrogenase family protein [Bacillus sp. OxB-1]BAQ09304.1 acyl-CoA dehydrogenases [Bacillus sp. OxB-1]